MRPAPGSDMTGPTELAGTRVLLVEDIDLVAIQIEEMLLEGGCQAVTVAGSVASALQAVRDGDLDAAVLDINVRGGNTFGVADELKARGVPFVFSSGDGARYLPDRFEEAPHVSKPFEAPDLWAALAKARQ
jgi:CheY-like chemotaxis protein